MADIPLYKDTSVKEEDQMDHALLVVVVVEKDDESETTLAEYEVAAVTTFGEMNSWFDQFDETVAEPNVGHLKYDVQSDGMVVVVVDTIKLMNTVGVFIEHHGGVKR